jgi:hypothetical protein
VDVILLLTIGVLMPSGVFLTQDAFTERSYVDRTKLAERFFYVHIVLTALISFYLVSVLPLYVSLTEIPAATTAIINSAAFRVSVDSLSYGRLSVSSYQSYIDEFAFFLFVDNPIVECNF